MIIFEAPPSDGNTIDGEMMIKMQATYQNKRTTFDSSFKRMLEKSWSRYLSAIYERFLHKLPYVSFIQESLSRYAYIKLFLRKLMSGKLLILNQQAVTSLINLAVGISECKRNRFHSLVFPTITLHEYDNYSLQHVKELGSDKYYNIFAPSVPFFLRRSTQLRKLMLEFIFSGCSGKSFWEGSHGDVLTNKKKLFFFDFSKQNAYHFFQDNAEDQNLRRKFLSTIHLGDRQRGEVVVNVDDAFFELELEISVSPSHRICFMGGKYADNYKKAKSYSPFITGFRFSNLSTVEVAVSEYPFLLITRTS